jgi:coenzyme Q-binding protein COQ10
MAYFKTSKHLPYAADDVFALVSDIGAYPRFIKWITAMRVSDEVVTDGVRSFKGEAVVGFKGFTERFTTQVTANPQTRSVRADLIEGPFRKLQADWTIEPRSEGGCVCTLAIDYEFKNILISMLASANESMAVDRIMSAYLAEAERRYGAHTPAPKPSA